jgi:hypothetical protein
MVANKTNRKRDQKLCKHTCALALQQMRYKLDSPPAACAIVCTNDTVLPQLSTTALPLCRITPGCTYACSPATRMPLSNTAGSKAKKPQAKTAHSAYATPQLVISCCQRHDVWADITREQVCCLHTACIPCESNMAGWPVTHYKQCTSSAQPSVLYASKTADGATHIVLHVEVKLANLKRLLQDHTLPCKALHSRHLGY